MRSENMDYRLDSGPKQLVDEVLILLLGPLLFLNVEIDANPILHGSVRVPHRFGDSGTTCTSLQYDELAASYKTGPARTDTFTLPGPSSPMSESVIILLITAADFVAQSLIVICSKEKHRDTRRVSLAGQQD
jgi:hypothetical protein